MAFARIVAVFAALVLATGCGSESPSDTPDPAKNATPEKLTPKRLAEALPDDDYFPKGAVVSVRCPGDPPCTADERQTQDASISVDLPLPEGVAHETNGFSETEKFQVPGGEYTENVWLRAYLYKDEAEAEGYRVNGLANASKMIGKLDTQPKKTDSGYTYGIRGNGSVEEIKIDDWTGYVRVLDAQFIHLDGRVGDERFDVFALMQKDGAVVTVDSSFTVQGRDKADAVSTVQDLLDEYLGEL